MWFLFGCHKKERGHVFHRLLGQKKGGSKAKAPRRAEGTAAFMDQLHELGVLHRPRPAREMSRGESKDPFGEGMPLV